MDNKLLRLRREFLTQPNLESSAQILAQLFRIGCLDSVVEMHTDLRNWEIEIEISEGITDIPALINSHPRGSALVARLLQGILIQKPHLVAPVLQTIAKRLQQFMLTSGFLEMPTASEGSKGYVSLSDHSQVQIGLNILNELQSYELSPSPTTATSYLDIINQHQESLRLIIYEDYNCYFDYGGATGRNDTSCNFLAIINELLSATRYNLLLIHPSLISTIPERDRRYYTSHYLFHNITTLLANYLLSIGIVMKSATMVSLAIAINSRKNMQGSMEQLAATAIDFRIDVWFDFITLLLSDCISRDYVSNPRDDYCPNCDCWNCC